MLFICLLTVIPGYILFGPLSYYLRLKGEIQRKKVNFIISYFTD
jgi:hypothetical protein